MTIGEESFVSHPSTNTWKRSTIAKVIQNLDVRVSLVLVIQRSSVVAAANAESDPSV